MNFSIHVFLAASLYSVLVVLASSCVSSCNAGSFLTFGSTSNTPFFRVSVAFSASFEAFPGCTFTFMTSSPSSSDPSNCSGPLSSVSSKPALLTAAAIFSCSAINNSESDPERSINNSFTNPYNNGGLSLDTSTSPSSSKISMALFFGISTIPICDLTLPFATK